MSEKTVSVPKISLMYKRNEFRVIFPLSDTEKQTAAKSAMDSMGLFGQMMNNISSINQLIDDIENKEKESLDLLLNNDYKKFVARIFLCDENKVREYKREREGEKEGGGVVNLMDGEIFALYPVIKIEDTIFYRADSHKASNGGLDIQKILINSLLNILKQHDLVYPVNSLLL